MLEQGFWRNRPLDDDERYLLQHLAEAHCASTFRGNVSQAVFLNAASGSNSILSGVAAALCSTGGLHAPITETYAFLTVPDPVVETSLAVADKRKIPGWGNSFAKDGYDPLWETVHCWFASFRHRWMEERVLKVTEQLHAAGKKIYPNPSCYTAAAAIALEMPAHLAPILFLPGRLDGWAKIYHDNQHLWATHF